MRRALLALVLLALTACPSTDERKKPVSLPESTTTTSDTESTPTKDAKCPAVKVTAGDVCVRASNSLPPQTERGSKTGDDLVAGAEVTIQVRPRGCISSSSKEIYARCSLSRQGNAFVASASFCIEPPTGVSLPDCGGGGYAVCTTEPLQAGTYTVEAEGTKVTFTVPSTIPAGGQCTRAPL
jgi:hypothetical protein